MRYTLVVLAACGAAGLAAAQKGTPTGHMSDAGRYSVVFPAKPSKADDEKALATASGTLNVYTTRVETGGLVYSVTWTDYPESFRDVSPAVLLDGVVGGLKGTDGEVTPGDDQPSSSGYHSRRVTVTAKDNTTRTRLVLQGRRLYLVQVSGKKDAVAKAKAADDFVNSFSLTK